MKILKWIGIILLIIFIIGFISVKMMNEDKPKVNPTPEADALAQKMLSALNKPGWDTLKYLKWEFPREHRYIWDKQNNKATISWDETVVTMNLDDQTGTALKAGVEIDGDTKAEALKNAWSLWCNDSFWMFAPYKIFDPNTTRSIVQHDGKDALLVAYNGGGVTPGDMYLWILGDDYVPTAYKMWVQIIPVGGVEFSWDKWIDLPSGAKVSTFHESGMMPIEMKGVEEGSELADLKWD